MCSPRSIVYLEIDNRQCVQSSSQCFQSATDVAAFLGALASLGSLNIPYKIEAVQSEWPSPALLRGGLSKESLPGRGHVSQPPPPMFLFFVPFSAHGCVSRHPERRKHFCGIFCLVRPPYP